MYCLLIKFKWISISRFNPALDQSSQVVFICNRHEAPSPLAFVWLIVLRIVILSYQIIWQDICSLKRPLSKLSIFLICSPDPTEVFPAMGTNFKSPLDFLVCWNLSRT